MCKYNSVNELILCIIWYLAITAREPQQETNKKQKKNEKNKIK